MKKYQTYDIHDRSLLARCVMSMLRPVLRFCLRRSIKLQEIIEYTKVTLLQVAEEELRRTGVTGNTSRLSVMTGVHRKDVARYLEDEYALRRGTNPVLRVIGQWQDDRHFQTKKGEPRVLSTDGSDSEFMRLVRSVSRDLNPYAVLFELERLGAVEKTKNGLRLSSPVYVPKGDPQEGLGMLARDADDLISAVDENIFSEQKTPHLHAKTEYDNIPASVVDEVKEWILNEGSAFHRKLRGYLSKFDRDINRSSQSKSDAVRVAVGTFSFIDRSDDENTA